MRHPECYIEVEHPGHYFRIHGLASTYTERYCEGSSEPSPEIFAVEDPRMFWRRMAVVMDGARKGASSMQDASLCMVLTHIVEHCVDLGMDAQGDIFPVEEIFRTLAQGQGFYLD